MNEFEKWIKGNYIHIRDLLYFTAQQEGKGTERYKVWEELPDFEKETKYPPGYTKTPEKNGSKA